MFSENANAKPEISRNSRVKCINKFSIKFEASREILNTYTDNVRIHVKLART